MELKTNRAILQSLVRERAHGGDDARVSPEEPAWRIERARGTYVT